MLTTYRKFLLSLASTVVLLGYDIEEDMSWRKLIGVGIVGVGDALVFLYSNGPDVRQP